MKSILVFAAALAATLGCAGMASAQNAFGDPADGTPGSAIGSGPIGPNTSPAPPPPLRPTPGGGTGPIDTFGYGNAGDGYSGTSAPGAFNGSAPNAAAPPPISPAR